MLGPKQHTQLRLALDGTALRDQALDALERTRGEYIAWAIVVAHNVIAEQGFVTADDIHEHCPPPADIDPRVIGAVLCPRNFFYVGTVTSRRAINHGRTIGVWRKK